MMWTETLEMTNTVWMAQVVDQMLRLDDTLEAGDVDHIAEELVARPRWRALSPEAAARKAFDEPEAVDGV